MSEFESAVNYVLLNEGGFSNDAHDNGGVTKYGISLRFLKNLTKDELKVARIFDEVTPDTVWELTIDQAKILYKNSFWDQALFYRIQNQETCNYIFDMAISIGIAPAIKCAQRATWAVMKKRDLLDDGILGDKTLDAINRRCGFLLMPALRSERAGYYRIFLNNQPDEKEFINGWLNRAYCA